LQYTSNHYNNNLSAEVISVSEEILQLSMNGSWMIDNIYTLDACLNILS